jgi:hypothetical protein
MNWPAFARWLGILAALAGLVCWLNEWWLETGALAFLMVACGVVVLLEDMSR